MSYAAKVKEEIYLSRPSKDRNYKAFCYGLLLLGKRFDENHIYIATEHITVSKLYGYAVKDSIGKKAYFCEHQTPRGSSLYTVELSDRDEIKKLMKFFDHYDSINYDLVDEENFQSFLRGAFMACGTVSEPNKSYHLEMTVPEGEIADLLFERLSELGYPPKSMQRRGQTVLYYKESEQIEDFLTMIGATHCSLQLMETKIYKDIRNRANRAANCDAANAGKMLKAAERQLADINLLREEKEFEELPAPAQAIAILRENNPDASLSELADLSGLTRSAVNHRMEQKKQAAEKVRIKRV